MQIRISPDDSCIIQMWCIDHWEDWYDPRNCVAGTIEQPTNGEGIGAGECREWQVSLRGNEKWLLPAVVSEGDVIEITGASGAWNDGTLGWNCVNGFTYAVGACVSAEAPGGSDPLQTANHMRLIMNIDGAWHDAYNTLTAVPGGVSDGQVYFQANDDTLGDNSGTVSFHVKLCRFDTPVIPITITYGAGSGVTQLDQSAGQTSWLISPLSEDIGGASGNSIDITFSEPVKITIQSTTGFVNRCVTTCFYSFISLSGVNQDTINEPDPPTSMTPALTGDRYLVNSGNATGTPTDFSAQILIEKV